MKEQSEENTKKEDVIIGIYDHKLSKKDNYFALIGLDILEGSEKNEFTRKKFFDAKGFYTGRNSVLD